MTDESPTPKNVTKLPRRSPRRAPRTKAQSRDNGQDRGWKTWFFAAGTAAAIALTIAGAENARTSRALDEADGQLKRGFSALAVETLEPVRASIARDPHSCQTLLAAYFGARRPERLEWAAQSCITAGVETSDTYLALGAARELANQDTEALQLFKQAAERFPQSPDPHYRLAQLYRRTRHENDAADSMLRAANLAPGDSQIAMRALELLSSVQRWSDARHLADRLKAAPTEDPEVKLVIARALLNGGDRPGAEAVTTAARELISKRPDATQLKEKLQISYGDVLSPPNRRLASRRPKKVETPAATPAGAPSPNPLPDAQPPLRGPAGGPQVGPQKGVMIGPENRPNHDMRKYRPRGPKSPGGPEDLRPRP